MVIFTLETRNCKKIEMSTSKYNYIGNSILIISDA